MKSTKKITVALIGNPNTGKSTLFTAIAGVHTHVGNFPGVTVEKKIGKVTWNETEVTLIDLPGTYSLSPHSEDEMVAVDVLLGRQSDVARPDTIACIVDASNLERNLYLVSQLLDLDRPLILILNMSDLARKKDIEIDIEKLGARLGIPVLCTEAHRQRGIEPLKNAILESPIGKERKPHRPFPEEFYRECDLLHQEFGDEELPMFLVERMLLDVQGTGENRNRKNGLAERESFLIDARQRLLQAGFRVPQMEPRVRYRWIKKQLEGICTRPQTHSTTTSDKLDRVFTHKIWGMLVFAVTMFLVFQTIYRFAVPFMELIEEGQNILATSVESAISPGAFRSLVVNGAIAGVGAVLVFLPQIVLLFFFIALLEDSGYMARAAFLMDRLMTKLGLSGKSFVPLMSSFACAIPGVMATRVIENRKDRMITILVAPLMSCSARLPVYLLLIGAFLPPTIYAGGWITLQGIVLFAMTFLGAVVAVPVAWTLRKTLFRGETAPFVMELPSYKWPSPRIVFSRVYDRGKAFVKRAGTLIFMTTIIVWALGYFPGDRVEYHKLESEMHSLKMAKNGTTKNFERREKALERELNKMNSQLMEQSILGRFGHTIEPVVRPLGWDWRIGVGAIAAFPAREVIISTLGTIYSLGADVDEEDQGLQTAIQNATWKKSGEKVFDIPVALSVMVFFALCAQCAPTLLVIRRETNSWRWPVLTFSYMTTLAYLGALATFQVGSRLIG